MNPNQNHNTRRSSNASQSPRDSLRSRHSGTLPLSPPLGGYGEGSSNDTRSPRRGVEGEERVALLSENQGGIISREGESNKLKLRIRFSTGRDMDLTEISSEKSIQEVKVMIREQYPDIPSEQHLRLIHQGRVLADTTLLSEFVSRGKTSSSTSPPSSSSRNYGTNQAGLSASDPQGSSHVTSPSTPLIFHGQILEEPPETTSSSEQSRIVPPVGFDRLQEAGFSAEDIQQIRSQFQTMNDIDPHATDPEVVERNRRLEESWIDNATTTLPDGTTEGTYHELLWGLLLGFFLGLLPIFWHQDHAFSRKNQLGILIGLFINLLFGGVMLLE